MLTKAQEQIANIAAQALLGAIEIAKCEHSAALTEYYNNKAHYPGPYVSFENVTGEAVKQALRIYKTCKGLTL